MASWQWQLQVTRMEIVWPFRGFWTEKGRYNPRWESEKNRERSMRTFRHSLALSGRMHSFLSCWCGSHALVGHLPCTNLSSELGVVWLQGFFLSP